MTVLGLDSRILFTLVVGAVALERLVELVISARNRSRLLARGGIEVGAPHYPVMVALHSTFLVAAPLEVWLLDRPWLPALAAAMGLVVVGTMALRYWSVASLGGRWCTRVVVLPNAPRVTGGPYRLMRHPNYLAVVLELAALPMLHAAWLTALVYSLGNALVLAVRIPVEEAALDRAAELP